LRVDDAGETRVGLGAGAGGGDGGDESRPVVVPRLRLSGSAWEQVQLSVQRDPVARIF
jgi:hypothetical protein